jgi:hypothetical protein
VSSNHLSWRKIIVLHKTCEQWGAPNNFCKRNFWEHWIEKETCIYFHVDHQGNKQKNIYNHNAFYWINIVQLNIDKGKKNTYAFANYSF